MFNDYRQQETNLQTGVTEKSSCLSCEEGEEFELVESILQFISSETRTNVMKFDVVVGGVYTF